MGWLKDADPAFGRRLYFLFSTGYERLAAYFYRMEKPKVFALPAVVKRLKAHIDAQVNGKVFWVKASVSQLRFDAKATSI